MLRANALLLIFLGLFCSPLSATAERDYYIDPSAEDVQQISYIIETLGNKPLAALLFYRGSLEEAGNSVDHVHPLRFLSTIFTNEKLKVAIRNVKNKTMAWDEWVSGMSTSFTRAAEADAMTAEILHDFAGSVGIDVNLIKGHADSQEWSAFIEAVLQHVPRRAGGSRYRF